MASKKSTEKVDGKKAKKGGPTKPDKKVSLKLNVPVLTRVEGEGALTLNISKGKISDLQLKIFEPPRLFEKLLVGRHYQEIPDMVSRICGICPVAYQISAVLAVENLFAVPVSSWVQQMRRVYYFGEWLQSHALHIHLLALPDFFHVNNVLELSAVEPAAVSRGMKLQALGNRLISLFGARSVNPVGVRVGGFYRAPETTQVDAILSALSDAKSDAKQLLEWICQLSLPNHDDNALQFCLQDNNAYPIMGRTLTANNKRNKNRHPIEEFEDFFTEKQLDYSTAFHCYYRNSHYLVGPLARFNQNYQFLHASVHEVLKKYGFDKPLNNNFHAIIARAAEIYQAILESEELLSKYQRPDCAYSEVNPRAGRAIGCSEAPRGLLWHRYDFNELGYVTAAKIVPPTSQNQAQIEEDIRNTLTHSGLNQDQQQLTALSEQVIRNYDPCISCATHFLRLEISRT